MMKAPFHCAAQAPPPWPSGCKAMRTLSISKRPSSQSTATWTDSRPPKISSTAKNAENAKEDLSLKFLVTRSPHVSNTVPFVNFGSYKFELRKFVWSQVAARSKSKPTFLVFTVCAFFAV